MYRRSARQRLALLTLLAATVTIVTLDFRSNPGGPIRRLQSFAVSVVGPLQEGIGSAFRPIGDFLGALGELPSLRKQNATLRAEKAALEERQREVPEILRENERLRALIGDDGWREGERLSARVISGSLNNFESSRLINRGADEGVQVGMAALAPEGLIGRVVFVAGSYSKVLLLNDRNHAVGARLTGSGETGLLKGRSEGDLLFELISPQIEVMVGETVVTSGYDGGIYPPGIPIGRVTRIRSDTDKLSKSAFVSPFANFGNLDLVSILLGSGPVSGGG